MSQSPNTITRQDLRHILAKWQSGQMDARQVHAWAEDRFATDKWDAEDEVANEVLGNLDMLDMNLVTSQGIPIFIEALDSCNTAADAAKKIDEYFSAIDMAARKTQLSKDPLYAKFCN